MNVYEVAKHLLSTTEGWQPQAAQLFDRNPERIDTYAPFIASISGDEDRAIDRNRVPEFGEGHTPDLIAAKAKTTDAIRPEPAPIREQVPTTVRSIGIKPAEFIKNRLVESH